MFCVPPKKSREYALIGEDGMIHIIEGTKDTVGLKSLQDNYRTLVGFFRHPIEQAHGAIMQDKLVHFPLDKSFLNLFGKYLRKKLGLSKNWENLSKAQLVYANVVSNMNETHPGFQINFGTEPQRIALANKIPQRISKINLFELLDFVPDISRCPAPTDDCDTWGSFLLKDFKTADLPWKPPQLKEKNKFALIDASAGTFRVERGRMYIPAIQARICDKKSEEFQSWSDYVTACSDYPGELLIRWTHLTEPPNEWHEMEHLYGPWPEDGILVFSSR